MNEQKEKQTCEKRKANTNQPTNQTTNEKQKQLKDTKIQTTETTDQQ